MFERSVCDQLELEPNSELTNVQWAEFMCSRGATQESAVAQASFFAGVPSLLLKAACGEAVETFSNPADSFCTPSEDFDTLLMRTLGGMPFHKFGFCLWAISSHLSSPGLDSRGFAWWADVHCSLDGATHISLFLALSARLNLSFQHTAPTVLASRSLSRTSSLLEKGAPSARPVTHPIFTPS